MEEEEKKNTQWCAEVKPQWLSMSESCTIVASKKNEIGKPALTESHLF